MILTLIWLVTPKTVLNISSPLPSQNPIWNRSTTHVSKMFFKKGLNEDDSGQSRMLHRSHPVDVDKPICWPT